MDRLHPIDQITELTPNRKVPISNLKTVDFQVAVLFI